MARQIGSQLRETLKESGYRLIGRKPGQVVLMSDAGNVEVWYANDDHAGYTIQVGRWGYEFGMELPS
jgi:hypothetical protein